MALSKHTAGFPLKPIRGFCSLKVKGKGIKKLVKISTEELEQVKTWIGTKDGNLRCRSRYPKQFLEESIAAGMTTYCRPKRPNNGRKTFLTDQQLKEATKGGRKLNEEDHLLIKDNRYVIPHNLYLCSLL